MKSRLLFFVALLFAALAIFSCQKDVETNVVDNINTDTSINQSRCPWFAYDFVYYGDTPFSKQWTITNQSTESQKYWFTARSYDGMQQQTMWQTQEINLNSWESKNIIAFSPTSNYPRIYGMYTQQSSTRTDCVTPRGYPWVTNFNYVHKTNFKGEGYWEVTGILENGHNMNIYGSTQLHVRGGNGCTGGTLLMDTPVRITSSGIPYKTQTKFKIIVEDGIMGNTPINCVWFSYYKYNDYPN